jgi:cobalt-zinc-cadmium efflux system outer membrane protein
MHYFYPTIILLLPLAGCAGPPQDYSLRTASWERMRQHPASADPGPDSKLPEGAGLKQLLAHARQHNPNLRAAFERWKAALERVPQATALPNPRLNFAAYLVEVETRVGSIQGLLGVSQAFPWFGKRELAGNVAFEESEAAREMLEAQRLVVDQGLRDTWYELYWVEQAILITEGNRDLLSHCESVARARMSTGLSSHADVIRSQIELGKLEVRVQGLRDLRLPLVARLNAALNRPSAARIPSANAAPLARSNLDTKQLALALAESSPLLRALDHRVAGAQFNVDLSGKAFYPDFFVGVDYTLVGDALASNVPGSGDDAVALKFGIDLPIWRSKYRAGVRSSQAQARGVRLEHQSTLRRLQAELEMALYRFRDADRRAKLYAESLVPKGEEALRALDSAYQAGDEGLLDLIDAQRVLLEFQLQVARAISDRAQALALVEKITGIQLGLEG